MKNRLRALRQQRGLSQLEFCETLGLSRQSLSSIERGKHSPSLSTAFRIAAFFKLRVVDIFEAEDP